MKKRGWIVLFLAFPLWMQGQSAREEIGKNPALAAGKYYAYQAPEEKLTPAPAGYEPFYISMFARHGSRYLTKEKNMVPGILQKRRSMPRRCHSFLKQTRREC